MNSERSSSCDRVDAREVGAARFPEPFGLPDPGSPGDSRKTSWILPRTTNTFRLLAFRPEPLRRSSRTRSRASRRTARVRPRGLRLNRHLRNLEPGLNPRPASRLPWCPRRNRTHQEAARPPGHRKIDRQSARDGPKPIPADPFDRTSGRDLMASRPHFLLELKKSRRLPKCRRARLAKPIWCPQTHGEVPPHPRLLPG
jgi:hypothetical protein